MTGPNLAPPALRWRAAPSSDPPPRRQRRCHRRARRGRWGAPAALVLATLAAALVAGVTSPPAGATGVPAAAPGSGAAGRSGTADHPPAWVRSRASVPPLPSGTRPLGRVPGASVVQAEVVLAPRHPGALTSFDDAVSTPGSPRFRHFLSRGAFAAEFGPTVQTVAAVRAWLVGRGLEVGPTAPDGLAVPVSGTAAGVGEAFGVHLEQYRLPTGRVVHAPDAAPLVPASLAGAVGGVVGLDDVTAPVPELARPAAGASSPAGPASSTPEPHATGPVPTSTCQSTINSSRQSAGALTVDQLAQAYSFSSLYATDEGAGVTIGVYELEPYDPSDITAFEDCYSPAITATVTPRPVDQSTAQATDGPGQGEAALDIEMAVGMAPAASIEVFDGPNAGSGPLDTYRAMVEADVPVISTSWGQCEAQTPSAVLASESVLFQQAVAQGQTMTAAAGDEGSEDCYVFPSSTDTRLQVDDPGSQPWVTSVGATTLSTLGPPPTESTWDSGLFSGTGGGGISTEWTMPAWQLGPGVQNSFTKVRDSFTGTSPCPLSSGPGTTSCREVPDVSSDGNPFTGVAVYCTCFGGWAKIGGSSMASPLWAALAALADNALGSPHAVGFLNPALYQAGCEADPPFNDVTVGTNQPVGSNPSDPPPSPPGPYYPATPGYDLATGLGTPDAAAVVAMLRAPPDDCPVVSAISATAGPATGGTAVTVSGANLAGVVEVDLGPGRPAAIESVSAGSVTVLTPPSPTGGWDTVPLVVRTADDAVGLDGATPFTYTGPSGYWTVASDGGIFTFGSVGFYGSMGGRHLSRPIVGMAATPDGRGYWLVASDGGIFAFGDAGFYGSMGGKPLAKPIVGMAPTSDGRGYWEVASDGGIFAFGDAGFAGSMGGHPLAKPVVGMAPTPDGAGYWEVASDGGIFAFGDAGFAGSMGGHPLAKPIVGMAATPDGAGYWEVASDGGIFAFGDAAFHGSTGGVRLAKPVVGMSATPDGNGYWMVASDGGIFAFGGIDGGFFGSEGGTRLARPMVGMSAPRGGVIG